LRVEFSLYQADEVNTNAAFLTSDLRFVVKLGCYYHPFIFRPSGNMRLVLLFREVSSPFFGVIEFDFVVSGATLEELGCHKPVSLGFVSHSSITALEEACRGNVCL
jgi:hypothetical protein